MEMKAFRDRNDWYYNVFKPGIASLILEGPYSILDLGCGTGVLGGKLRELDKAQELVGVEIFSEAADEAASHYEKIYLGNLEYMELDYKKYFDFAICGDVIEHSYSDGKYLETFTHG